MGPSGFLFFSLFFPSFSFLQEGRQSNLHTPPLLLSLHGQTPPKRVLEDKHNESTHSERFLRVDLISHFLSSIGAM